MSPIFKCLICRKDIERSKKSFWSNKGHLLCSSCLDKINPKKDFGSTMMIYKSFRNSENFKILNVNNSLVFIKP